MRKANGASTGRDGGKLEPDMCDPKNPKSRDKSERKECRDKAVETDGRVGLESVNVQNPGKTLQSSLSKPLAFESYCVQHSGSAVVDMELGGSSNASPLVKDVIKKVGVSMLGKSACNMKVAEPGMWSGSKKKAEVKAPSNRDCDSDESMNHSSEGEASAKSSDDEDTYMELLAFSSRALYDLGKTEIFFLAPLCALRRGGLPSSGVLQLVSLVISPFPPHAKGKRRFYWEGWGEAGTGHVRPGESKIQRQI